jgi:hypothetical protein
VEIDKLNKVGNENLLNLRKVAFLCSRRTPDTVYFDIFNWVNQLSSDECIICGNHSFVEQKVFTLLLQRRIPVILVLAEAMRTEWSEEIESALKENRMLIVTQCDESVHFVCKDSAADRNEIILSLADAIVIGYCAKGGNIARQIAGRENTHVLVETMDLQEEDRGYKFQKHATLTSELLQLRSTINRIVAYLNRKEEKEQKYLLREKRRRKHR